MLPEENLTSEILSWWNIVMLLYSGFFITKHQYIYFEMLCCYIAEALIYIFRNTKISYFTSPCCFSPTLPPPLPVSPCKPCTQNSGGTITSSVHLFSILSKYFGASYYLDFDLMTHFLKFRGIKAPWFFVGHVSGTCDCRYFRASLYLQFIKKS